MSHNLCSEYLALMQAVLDGVATPSDEAKWKAHAETCENCRNLFRELKSLKAAMPATAAEPPYGLKEKILQNIHEEGQTKALRNINRRQRATHSFMGVAAALVLFVVGSWVLSGYGGKVTESDGFANDMQLESVVETVESEMAEAEEDVGVAVEEGEAEAAPAASESFSGGTADMIGAPSNSFARETVLKELRRVLLGIDLGDDLYKTCMYLDCGNLPQGREAYLLKRSEGEERSLSLYRTDDYLGFINGAGLELNFSLELTESEMQTCGLATDGDLTLVVVATTSE